jgi:ABC-2 type transport system ATP-binding protein
MNAIEVSHLRRTFTSSIGVIKRSAREIVAVDDVSFEIQEGELFGLLGPNGAGKTTTTKMLTTLLIPTGGTATIEGFDVVKEADQVRKRIGFIFGGERGLYWRLSGIDNLRYFASLYNVDPDVTKKRIEFLLDMVGLQGRGDEKVQGYSRGMKKRLHVARTLLHNPDILFLDEPTLGLDPVGAREFRQVILNLQSEKKTILLTTHYMFEADALCDRIAIINHGRIIALDTPAGLKSRVHDMNVVEVEIFGIPESTLAHLRSLPFVDALSVEDYDQKQMLLIQTGRGLDGWSFASRPWRMPMSAWWEAVYEYQSFDPLLADHPGRGRDDHAPAVNGRFYPVHRTLPADHHRRAGTVHAAGQRRGRGHVRRGRQWADRVMVEPALHLGQQHQL